MDKEKRDKKYNRQAREYPTYICLVFPLIIFLYVMANLDKQGQNTIQWFITKALLWGAAIFPALFFLLKMLIRNISKLLVDNVLFAWCICPHYMYRILLNKGKGISEASWEKIKTVYEKKKLDISESDENQKKKIIIDVVSDIKNSTREDNIVFEYNFIYGFYRNLFGGLIIIMILFGIALYMLSEVTNILAINVRNIIGYTYCVTIPLTVICLIMIYVSDRDYALKMFHFFLKN